MWKIGNGYDQSILNFPVFTRLTYIPQTITDDGIRAVCENCPQLQTLNFSGCESLTDATLKKLGASCRGLKQLEAAGCSHFTDSGFQALASVRLLIII